MLSHPPLENSHRPVIGTRRTRVRSRTRFT